MAIYRGAGGASDSVDDATVNAVAASAAAAAASATAAAGSASSAASSAASASGSVSSVTTSASNAATSASQAATSASNASTSATSASNDAVAASASSVSASTSASNASNSASAAGISETNAASSASSASTSATNSANSAASALAIYGNTTAMNNAVAAASTSASNAATSASNAAASAATATTQATNASNAAVAAEASKNTAVISSYNAGVSEYNASVSAAAAASAATDAVNAVISDGLSDITDAVAITTTNANNAATSATNAATSATQAAASAASASAIVLGVASGLPSIRPTLNLDFANSGVVDPRITFTRASTGTYYDGKTTAKAEENLLLQSQSLFPSPWVQDKGYVGTLGSELVTNGGFVDSSGWILGNGWSIASNVATANTTVGAESLSRAWSGENNKSYLVTATITMLATPNNQAAVMLNIGGTGQNVVVTSQNNLQSGTTYSISSVARPTTVNAGAFTVKVSSNLNYAMNYTIDNVSIKEVTQNSLTAPDGTLTASTFTADVSNAIDTQSVTAVAGDYTFSVFLRRVTGTGNIDITANSGGTWVTQTITSSWARYTVTQTLTAGARTPGVRIVTSGDQVEVWGAQLEQRSSVTAYTPTTTQAITNYIPVLQTASSGVPRLDYDPVTDEAKGLLIEEARTNLLTYSSNFDNAAWFKGLSSVTANTTISPDGTLTADTLSFLAAANANLQPATAPTVTIGQQYTYSVYVRASSAVSNVNIAMAGSDVAIAVTTEWQRVSRTVTASGSTLGPTLVTRNAVATDIYIWGAQLEAGAFATSYIPTTTAQATRAADSASMTGTNFSSWYRTDAATLFVDCNIVNAAAYHNLATIIKNDGTNTGYGVLWNANGRMNYFMRLNGGYNPNLTTIGSSGQVGGAHKVAIGVDGGTIIGASDSTLGATVSSYYPQNISANALRIGAGEGGTPSYMTGHIKSITYYPKRLTNTELQALTA